MWRQLALPTILAVAGATYALDHGVYVGTASLPIPAGYETFLQKRCQYLFVTGIVEQDAINGLRQMTNEAHKDGLIIPAPDRGSCRFFAYH